MPGVVEPRTGLSMGQSTELMAKQWKITREAQDELALREPREGAPPRGTKASTTISSSTYLGLASDNNIRADTSPRESSRSCRPTFDLSGLAR